jgi:glutathione-regulated potassium-efflux system ancillary protein KefG
MYDLYPDFHIHVEEEQEVLKSHDLIVWQHPFYWYSSPSLLKEWIDIVLEHGFAYGREGKALAGKRVMTAITAGGRREVYREGGLRQYAIRQLLAPFELTARLCNMQYLPPFVVHGTHLLDENGIAEAGSAYRKVILSLRDGIFSEKDLSENEYANDIIT